MGIILDSIAFRGSKMIIIKGRGSQMIIKKETSRRQWARQRDTDSLRGRNLRHRLNVETQA